MARSDERAAVPELCWTASISTNPFTVGEVREALAKLGLHVVSDADMRVLAIVKQMVKDSPMWMRSHLPTLHDAVAYAPKREDKP